MIGHQTPRPKGGSVTLGVILLIVGAVLFAQKFGWIPVQIDWVLPSLLVAWGFSELYRGLQP